MKPKREIEILEILKDKIEKRGLKYGLCYEIQTLKVQGKLPTDEYFYLKDKFIYWAVPTPCIYHECNEWAAPPGQAQPRIDYLRKQIEELKTNDNETI